MSGKLMKISDVRRRGLEVLREHLGVADMVRFLNLYDSGSGNYTEERRAWNEGQTVDAIVRRIRKRSAKTP